MSILLGSIDDDDIEADGTSFIGRVFAQAVINIRVNCNLKKALNDSVCCQSLRIDVTLSTELIQQINAFGVEFPNQTFLEYSDPQNNMAKTFVASGLDFLGFASNGGVLMLRANGQFMNLKLRYLRFVIKNSESTNTTLVVVLPTVGGLILIMLLSTIAVVIFAIKWRKRKKTTMLLDKDPQKAIDNANC